MKPDDHRSNRFKFWREGWVGSRIVAWAHPTATLRLTPESASWGDIEVKDGDSQCGYEIAEAVDAEMLIAFRKGATRVDVSDHELCGDMTREWVPRLISMEAAKGYPPGTSLIIYLDMWDDEDELPRNELPGLIPRTPHGFRSIWILNSGGHGAWQIFPELQHYGGRLRSTCLPAMRMASEVKSNDSLSLTDRFNSLQRLLHIYRGIARTRGVDARLCARAMSARFFRALMP
jgi:hypothetical protein